jgi:hypothetical protein
MKGRLGVLLVAAVAGIGLIAAVDAFRGDSSQESLTEETVVQPSAPGLSTPQPSAPGWPGRLDRMIPFGRAVGSSWESFWAFEPGSYALRGRFAFPREADVDIWFESVTGTTTIDLLGRGRPRHCGTNGGRYVCEAALDFTLTKPDVLRLLVRKLSPDAIVVQLQVGTEKNSE